MRDYEKDNQLKDLSISVYKGNETYKPRNYMEIETRTNAKNGFNAAVFTNGKEIVIVYRGTDEAKDAIGSDIDLALSRIPTQAVDARNLRTEYAKDLPGQKIILTGHSLGGSLAQIIGSETGDRTVTFNAYGTGQYMDENTNYDNIVNYGNTKDVVFMSNINCQRGRTYVIDNYKNDKGEVGIPTNSHDFYLRGLYNHKAENMGDITKSVEYKRGTSQNERIQKFKLSIEKTVDLKYIDSDQIITIEEIENMPIDEFLRNEECIYEKMKQGKVMTKVQAQKRAEKLNRRYKSPASSASPTNGRWVTINGNHVLIED